MDNSDYVLNCSGCSKFHRSMSEAYDCAGKKIQELRTRLEEATKVIEAARTHIEGVRGVHEVLRDYDEFKVRSVWS